MPATPPALPAYTTPPARPPYPHQPRQAILFLSPKIKSEQEIWFGLESMSGFLEGKISPPQLIAGFDLDLRDREREMEHCCCSPCSFLSQTHGPLCTWCPGLGSRERGKRAWRRADGGLWVQREFWKRLRGGRSGTSSPFYERSHKSS